MLKSIINNFVYRKVFKETNINDIKKYYKNELKSSFKILIFSLAFTILTGTIAEENISKFLFFPSVIFFSLLIMGLIVTFFTSVWFIYELKNIFSSSTKEMKIIKEKNFDLNYTESKEDKKEHFKFNGYDFTKNKSNYILHEKLKKEDLLFLKDEFKKFGKSEKEITEILKERISTKESFDITLEDFCFLVKALNEEEEKRNKEEKRSHAENMLNNIFYDKKNEYLSVENILEKEKIIA